MGHAETLMAMLDDGGWHPAAEMRAALGDDWKRVLEASRDAGCVIQEKRDGKRSSGRDGYSYRLCWPRPGTLNGGRA